MMKVINQRDENLENVPIESMKLSESVLSSFWKVPEPKSVRTEQCQKQTLNNAEKCK